METHNARSCINCIDKKVCVQRTGAHGGHCNLWVPHMVENHQKVVFDYNQSARSNYGKENVIALTPDGLYFLKNDAATAPEHEEPPPGLRNLPRTPPRRKLEGIAEEREDEVAPGGEADMVGGERVGGGRSPPPSYQQDQPSGSPLTSSPSANLARAVMASPGFKSFEAKQNRQIADLRQDINTNLGQITDIKLELKSGFSNVSDGINKGLTSVESMIKRLTNTISNVESNQTQTRDEMTEIRHDIMMNRTDLERMRRDVEYIQLERRPGPDQNRRDDADQSRGDDAIQKLADILSKQATPSKEKARLPHFTLPKLAHLPNGTMDCIKYHSWKQKCQAAFRECSVGDSLGVNLIQNEQSLPKRYREQISHCSTVDGIFTVLDTLCPPLATQFEKLKQQLVKLPSALTYQQQLDNYNDILLLLNSMISFFPDLDIGLSELTAALSSFQSADLLAGLPEQLARFESLHQSSGQTYISLLESYCQRRRSDVNTIMTSLHIYRPEERSVDLNNIAVRGGGGGNGGGLGEEGWIS